MRYEGSDWSEARVLLLRRLWHLGWTGQKIADELGEGMTKNGVIGKAHRIGLTRRVSGWPKKPKVSRPVTAKPPKPVVVRLNPMPRVIGMAMQAQRKFAEGNSPFKSCQFIAGTGRPWTKCGAPTVRGHSWCQGHCERVYRPRESGETA